MIDFEMTISIAAGLTILGLGCIMIDFFLVRLVRRMHPQGTQSWTQMDVSHLNLRDHKRFLAIPRKYEDVTSHKMKKLGLVIFFMGLFLLSACGVWHWLAYG